MTPVQFNCYWHKSLYTKKLNTDLRTLAVLKGFDSLRQARHAAVRNTEAIPKLFTGIYSEPLYKIFYSGRHIGGTDPCLL